MELLTLSRMARRLGVGVRWLRDEAVAGRIPCIKAGSKFIFEAKAVETEIACRAATERLEVAHVG